MDAGPPVSQEHLDALCEELKAVVDDAASCGNEVVETWTGFGQAAGSGSLSRSSGGSRQ